MSDGMSDANVTGSLGVDIFEAVYQLRDALKAARRGHRGLRPSLDLARLNRILEEAGVELHLNLPAGERW